MRKLSDLINEASQFLSSEIITWAVSEAEEVGAEYVVFHFKVEGCEGFEGINLIVKYAPYTELVPNVFIEALLSKELEAKRFIQDIYPTLLRDGFEVAVKKDGISAIRSVPTSTTISEALIACMEEVRKVLGCKDVNLKYEKYALVGEWASFT